MQLLWCGTWYSARTSALAANIDIRSVDALTKFLQQYCCEADDILSIAILAMKSCCQYHLTICLLLVSHKRLRQGAWLSSCANQLSQRLLNLEIHKSQSYLTTHPSSFD